MPTSGPHQAPPIPVRSGWSWLNGNPTEGCVAVACCLPAAALAPCSRRKAAADSLSLAGRLYMQVNQILIASAGWVISVRRPLREQRCAT